MAERTLRGDLRRYIVDYRWNWGITHKIITRWYGGQFTIADLKRLFADAH